MHRWWFLRGGGVPLSAYSGGFLARVYHCHSLTPPSQSNKAPRSHSLTLLPSLVGWGAENTTKASRAETKDKEVSLTNYGHRQKMESGKEYRFKQIHCTFTNWTRVGQQEIQPDLKNTLPVPLPSSQEGEGRSWHPSCGCTPAENIQWQNMYLNSASY